MPQLTVIGGLPITLGKNMGNLGRMLRKHKVWGIKLIPDFLMDCVKLLEDKIEERVKLFLLFSALIGVNPFNP
jgi:hypothetical protein